MGLLSNQNLKYSMNPSQIFRELEKIIEGEIFQDDEILRFYSVDASLYQVIPKMVIFPKNEKDIIKIIKYANKNKISVTPRGAGTGLVGNSLNTGIILDLKNMNSIKGSKNFVTVQPGVLKGNLDNYLKSRKKFFPPNPSIGVYCSIGGIIGNNASGSRTLKYGSAIDNISEITFVDGKGKKIKLPSDKKFGKKILKLSEKINLSKYPQTSKNSCGYRLDQIKSINDTHKILVGSEGTLGIIVSAKLKTRDIPNKKILFIIEYNSVQKAAKNCLEIRETNPSAIEFVDRETLKNFNFNFKKNTQCLLFVEYDSNLKINEKKLCKVAKMRKLNKIQSEKEIQRWWKYRDLALAYSLKSIKTKDRVPHIIEDAAVPLEKLGELFSLVEHINKKFQTRSVMYGHAGNGNIHVRIISNRKNIRSLQKISLEYFDRVIKLGGTITAEHGDGIARSEYIEKQYGTKNYLVFKELKKMFDPKKILNPGKITDYRYRLKHLEMP